MRNRLRVLAFDILAPLGAIAALVVIGLVLGWPLWWVSVCSIIGLLIVEAIVINVVLFRRDGVTAGTDDQRPEVRLAIVAVATAALVAALVLSYQDWWQPDREFDRDSAEVVQIATDIAVATATFSPGAPEVSIDRAASFMAPDRAEAFKDQLGKAAADLDKRKVSAQGKVISAGLEALGPAVASVAVIMRGIQSTPGQPPTNSVLSLRIALAKNDGRWVVMDVSPINAR